MFCLYCGMNLPQDAVFCNRCGKQQNVADQLASNVTILPLPSVSEAPIISEKSPSNDMPIVRGTPSTSDSSSGESSVHPASRSTDAIRPQAQSSRTLSSPQHSTGRTNYQGFQTQPPRERLATSPVHSSHTTDQQMTPDGMKPATNLSRRAVLTGLAGITGLAVVGGGVVLFEHSRTVQPSSASSVSSSSSTPPAAVVNLTYSTNLDQWNINYDQPGAIPLSTTPPVSNWTLPPNNGIQQLYGLLMFGDRTQVGVVVNRLTDFDAGHYYDAEVIFNFDGGTDFTNQPSYQSSGGGSQAIEFTIAYSNGSHQQFAISIYTDEVNTGYGLSYYRACVRQGTARLDGVDYPIAITSENNDGIYSNLDSVDVTLDLNGDGKFEDNEHFPASKPFIIKGTSYVVESIKQDGSSMTIVKSH